VGHARDAAMTALIFGLFASGWFGWAQEDPPRRWRAPLAVGSVLSLLTAVAGGLLAWRNWSSASALSEPGAMRAYGILVGAEFAIAAVGAVVLALRRRREFIAPWVCLVVGVHFWPLAPLLANPALHVLGALLVVIAVLAVLPRTRGSLPPSAITGAGAGTALLVFGVWGAVAALTA
jgi:hypothetical protein